MWRKIQGQTMKIDDQIPAFTKKKIIFSVESKQAVCLCVCMCFLYSRLCVYVSLRTLGNKQILC